MSRIHITAEDQIQRINNMKTRVQEIQDFGANMLLSKPNPKRWNALEVVEHMYLGFVPYEDKLKNGLQKCRDKSDSNGPFVARWWTNMLLKNFPPQKDGTIKLKMKTMQKFEPDTAPQITTSDDPKIVFDRFYYSLDTLKDVADKARFKEVKDVIFNSSVGAWVRFYIPECVEFILRHNERHMAQLERALNDAAQSK